MKLQHRFVLPTPVANAVHVLCHGREQPVVAQIARVDGDRFQLHYTGQVSWEYFHSTVSRVAK